MSTVIRELDVDNRFSPKPSSYDRFNAGLIASILLCGFMVLSLFVVWLFGGAQPGLKTLPPIWPVVKYPDDDRGNGLEHDLDAESNGFEAVELNSLMESVQEAVSAIQAEDGSPGGGGYGPGIPGIPDPIRIRQPVEQQRKWQLSYEVDNLEQYKHQLDFFEIEIGVVASRENDIWRIADLSSDATVRLSSREAEQKSRWFAHAKPTFQRWDRAIARNSGVAVEGMLFIQFFPEDLQARINQLETAQLIELGRELEEVAVTKVRFFESAGSFSISVTGFEFR